MTACHSGQDLKPLDVNQSGIHKVVVKEILQTTKYTIMLVKENDSEQWIATTSMQPKMGGTYYYEGGFQMKNFESKELKRVFPSVVLLESISTEPIIAQKTDSAAKPHAAMTKSERKDIKIEPIKDGITIAKLYADKKSYAGKVVKIKGQVVKFTPSVLNKNWFHIQDGTEYNGVFDLTASSDIEVKVGDIITIEGKIVLDKNIGAGYVYEVLMEDAVKK